MSKAIYLEVDEEITSVVDRIRKVKEKEVVLIIPKRAVVLTSVVNLKLLKRQAKLLEKEVSIVTTDRIGKNLAAQVGFPVYQKLEGKSINTEAIPRTKVPIEIDYRKRKIEKPEELPSEVVEYKEPENKEEPQEIIQEEREVIPFQSIKTEKRIKKSIKLSFRKNKAVLGFILFSFLIAFGVFLLIYPKVTVLIKPKGDPLSSDLEISVATGVNEKNFEENIIPGEIIEVIKESSQKFKATGKIDIGEKAKGTITISNKYSTSPQTLVSGTRFKSSGGLIFRITNSVTIPGATVEGGDIVPGTTNASIIANQSGEKYNIPPSHFTISSFAGTDKYEKIYGDSSVPTTGGSTKVVTAVSENDITNAKKSLSTELFKVAEEELKNKDIGSKKIFDQAIKKEIISAEPNPKLNELGEEFELKVKIKVWTIVFDENQLKDLASERLAKKVPKGRDLIDDGKSDLVCKLKKIDSKQMVLKVKITGFVAKKLDQSLITENIKGKTKDEALNYLNTLPEIREAQVILWPNWFKKIPQNKKSIKIQILIEKITSK